MASYICHVAAAISESVQVDFGVAHPPNLDSKAVSIFCLNSSREFSRGKVHLPSARRADYTRQRSDCRSDAVRIPFVPPWWAERFRVANRFFQEGCPFTAFWMSHLFRPSIVDWAIMSTEMMVISAKNLLRSAYQKQRLYQMTHQLYELVFELPLSAAAVVGGSVNLNYVRSLANIG
eukprot:IDg10316t1